MAYAIKDGYPRMLEAMLKDERILNPSPDLEDTNGERLWGLASEETLSLLQDLKVWRTKEVDSELVWEVDEEGGKSHDE